MTDAEAPLRLPRPAVDDMAQPFLRRRARGQPDRRAVTDFQQNLLHLVAHVSLAKATGTTAAAARSVVPHDGGGGTQLRHARLADEAGAAAGAQDRACDGKDRTRERAPTKRTRTKYSDEEEGR
jgi:hypothetical protein